MGEFTGISWCDHTFNAWWGCSRVSPACRFCYAETWASRWGHELWHRNGPRRLTSESNWKTPARWNRDALAEGVRRRVFCASMSDVFEDHPDVIEARARLWGVIEATPALDWLLLTKRIENVAGMVPWGDTWPGNAWIGTSVENRRFAGQRIPELLKLRGASVRFLSCEPLLGSLDLTESLADAWTCPSCGFRNGHWTGSAKCFRCHTRTWPPPYSRVDWVIAGGESGPRARPSDPDWFRALRDQCREAGVPFHLKQAGAPLAREWGCTDRTGRDPGEWPEAFPQDFPQVAGAAA
jgi:protein gp37